MDPIEEVIHTSFLPSLFGRAEPLPEELKKLVSLSPAQGGIGIPDLKRESLEQFNASLDITAPHVNSIVTQSSKLSSHFGDVEGLFLKYFELEGEFKLWEL